MAGSRRTNGLLRTSCTKYNEICISEDESVITLMILSSLKVKERCRLKIETSVEVGKFGQRKKYYTSIRYYQATKKSGQ